MKRNMYSPAAVKIRHLLIAVLLIVVLALPHLAVPVLAEDEDWNSSVYHIGDFVGVTSDDFRVQLNAENDNHIRSSQFDYVVMIAGESNYGDTPFTEYLDYIYNKNSLGYGPNHDGLLLGLDADHEQIVIRLFGRAYDVFSRDRIDSLVNEIRSTYVTKGYEEAVSIFCYSAYETVSASGTTASASGQTFTPTFDTIPVSLNGNDPSTTDISSGSGSGSQGMPNNGNSSNGLPSWYVTDPQSFVEFHNDENVPRLIDNADILTPEEEAAIEARLDKIRMDTRQDIVIYTDTTSYGIDNETYEMDFYVYNGYGIGPNFDGLMLFINMDPANREMVSTGFGKTREVFTAVTSNQLDDILYEYLTQQMYADAFLNWAAGVENLLKYGIVDMPSWYGAYLSGESMEGFNQVKLINEVGNISARDTELIEKTMADLSSKYNTDVVVYLTHRFYDLTPADSIQSYTEEEMADVYLDRFWEICGYGVGPDHRGIVLGIFVDEDSDNKIHMRSYGTGGLGKAKELKKEIEERFESLTLLNLGSGDYQYNINRYLDFLGKFLKNGWLPHTWPVRIFWAVICAFGGLLTGSFTTSAAKRKNNAVKEATNADAYLVAGSFGVQGQQDIHTGTRVTTRRIERNTSSSSSSRSSSSSSSYSSHSSSSSGRSGSTSRRSF